MQDDISGWTEWNAYFDEIDEISSPSELHGLLTRYSLCDTGTNPPMNGHKF